LRRLVCSGVLPCLFACSTPISPFPQLEDEEPYDSGPEDAGRSDGGSRDAAGGEAGAEAGVDIFDCEVYGTAAACPGALPANNAACDPGANNGRCFYPGQPEGQLRIAQCEPRASGRGTWRLVSARCTYRCATELPQTGNLFSLLTGTCSSRPVFDCHGSQARTSQEGVDQFLRDIVRGCGFPATYQLGVTFNSQGCANWLHYQLGRELTDTQKQCLADRLEGTRVGCSAGCALNPSMAP
jgi:hypothetical protein